MGIYDEFKKQAIEKLEKELSAVGGSKENVVKKPIMEALVHFCKSDGEFAQAVAQSDKTFKDCIEFVLKGVGNSISDFDAFRKAAQFYFTDARIFFDMRIELNPFEEEKPKNVLIDITDLI